MLSSSDRRVAQLGSTKASTLHWKAHSLWTSSPFAELRSVCVSQHYLATEWYPSRQCCSHFLSGAMFDRWNSQTWQNRRHLLTLNWPRYHLESSPRQAKLSTAAAFQECVLVLSPSLGLHRDPTSFAIHFLRPALTKSQLSRHSCCLFLK